MQDSALLGFLTVKKTPFTKRKKRTKKTERKKREKWENEKGERQGKKRN